MDLAVVAKEIKKDDLLQMYYYLRLTRTLEERITALYRQGRIMGGVYTSHGMEAIAVGYASALERDDIIAPYHRDMGAFLIRGITPGEVIAQYLGKRTGPTRGKDGNVHIGDLKRGWRPARRWRSKCAASRGWSSPTRATAEPAGAISTKP